MVLSLRYVLGVHLVNPAETWRLRAVLKLLVPGTVETLIVSFDGIESLSPSCATALLLAIGGWRKLFPGAKVRIADLTVRTRATIEASRAALQLSPGDSEPADGDMVREFVTVSAYGCAKGGVFLPPTEGPAIYVFSVYRIDDDRRAGVPRVVECGASSEADQSGIRDVIAEEIQRGTEWPPSR